MQGGDRGWRSENVFKPHLAGSTGSESPTEEGEHEPPPTPATAHLILNALKKSVFQNVFPSKLLLQGTQRKESFKMTFHNVYQSPLGITKLREDPKSLWLYWETKG